jgi:hypothetical protein
LTLYRVFSRLYKYSSFAYKKRQYWVKGAKTENWFLTRLTWPRAIFVSSVASSYNPVREALYLVFLVWVLLIQILIVYRINSISGKWRIYRLFSFLYDLIAHYILIQKFFSVITWYFSIRNKSRISNFRSWIGTKIFSLQKSKSRTKYIKGLKSYLNINMRYSRSFALSFKLLVGKNLHLDIISPT